MRDVSIVKSQLPMLLKQPCYQAALSDLAQRGGKWKFGPREWIPDEFERLERAGLVVCHFGAADLFSPFIRARELTLTANGKTAVEACASVVLPRHVGYSYKAALESRNRHLAHPISSPS